MHHSHQSDTRALSTLPAPVHRPYPLDMCRYMGISDASAAGLIIFLPGCSFFGSLLGGVVGDWAEARDPDRGRVRVALVSVSASILIVVIMFYIIPPHSSSYAPV